MKIKLLLTGLLIGATTSLNAVTNDLSGLLQKGLFEEEANRNLDAASTAYETLVKQFDKDRQIGATAVFRLGEVYRKQGKTNEAALQYERIVRDFAEQTTLVTLSRQNLAGLGTQPSARQSNETTPTPWHRVATVEYEQAKQLLKQIKSLSPDEMRQTLPSLTPDAQLSELLTQLDAAIAKQAELGQDFGPDSPAIKRLIATREVLNKQIDERIAGIIKALQLKVTMLETAFAQAEKSKTSEPAVTATVVDEEEAEIRRIQGMIQNSPDLINAQSGDPSMTPLGRAASKGQLRVAGFLLDHGADVNLNLPLSQAAGGGHKAMVELLLKYGAPVNAATGSGETALQRAAQRGFVSVVEVLLDAKADPNLRDDTDRTALTLAVENNFAPAAAALLARGANPNIVCKTRKNWASDRTTCGAPIHFAITRPGDAMLALLLTNRAEVMLRNPFGETPLAMAASLGLTSKARQLIAAGAEVNPAGAANSGTATPLYYAVSGGHREVAALLLEQGANPNVRMLSGQEGVTPLMIAASKGDAEMVALLLKHKAEPNLADSRNNTALWNAIIARSAKTVRALLAGGANPDTTSPDGSPVLMSAVGDIRDSEIVAALIEAKVKVNVTNTDALTPLHYAVSVNRKDLVELLLAAGADANARDQAGKTPLNYTKSNPVQLGIPSAVAVLPYRASGFPGGANAPAESVESKPADIAGLLRQHGALDELPDFERIRITRQGLAQPLVVFFKGPKITNQFTLLETVMAFYARPSIYAGNNLASQNGLTFPDFGRIIIRRPSPKPGGKEQEIKVNLLNAKGDVDCANDVPVVFGDVIEIPERVHALNEPPPDLARELERMFTEANRATLPGRQLRDGFNLETNVVMLTIRAQEAARKADAQRFACLQKTIQLVVAGERTSFAVYSWKEGFLERALAKAEARAALRSSSDLSRVKVTRRDAKSGKSVVLTVDATDQNVGLWLQDGDVIEVPDKP